ncbi:MAG: exodeoxyribonuclease VII large subunit [Thermoguttaceae bacterium]|jgi:exodeoxyribonuclease VII large subunit|nr:exodeoxyribonuclease VII large subunit [Thermoguttaceae bacterium]
MKYRYLFPQDPEDAAGGPTGAPHSAKPPKDQDSPRGPVESRDESEEPDERVVSVSELTARIQDILERSFPSVWVAGEIADFARPQSGHCYFTLKDDKARISAVVWRMTASRVRFDLHDGLEVICRGHVEVYAPRGKYQLIVEAIEPKGIGALELALRQLRDRLAREGLFDPSRKRGLPRFPRRIAVVTSPTGAAIRDFLEVLRRRWGAADVLVVPVRVQGEGSAQEVAAAIGLVNRLALPIDCLAVLRGGGSLEDLWAFNEEVVVRAIHASRIPVVTGIGHEIDVTLADLVADVRALTPSEAAERVVPSADEILGLLGQYRRRMTAALRARLLAARRRLETLAGHRAFRWPAARLHEWARRLDEIEARSNRAVRQRVKTARDRIESLAGRLDSLSPLAVLGRGYSLTQREADGHIVRDAADVVAGERIVTRLAGGRLTSRVEP